MIIKDGENLIVKCDICGVTAFFKKFDPVDDIANPQNKTFPLPEGWENYNEGRLSKAQFCPKKTCKRFLDILVNGK